MTQTHSNICQLIEQKLQALQNDISLVTSRSDEIKQRHSRLLQRQNDIIQSNGDSNIQDTDMIELNVGGTKMRVLRNTLTLIKGSRLDILFSGRWESKLLRDEDERAFMDVDPHSVKKIIEYLCLVKLKLDTTYDRNKVPDLPKVCVHERGVFDMYVDFFV